MGDLSSSKQWLDWADEHMLSSANWGVYDKEGEANAALTWPQPNASHQGGWSMEQLSESGKWVRAYLRGEGAAPAPAPAPFEGCCLNNEGACMCGWCSDSLGRCLTCGGMENSSIPDTCGDGTLLSVQV